LRKAGRFARSETRPKADLGAGAELLARPAKGHYTFARNRPAGCRRRLQIGLNHAPKALICLKFCSLRLSVRTPPFHGGESGSIPLGSAIPVPTKRFSSIDENLLKQFAAYLVGNNKGGVMDIVVAFLALISIGVFAAHTLDAMRTG
jgi:hypothetical protein